MDIIRDILDRVSARFSDRIGLDGIIRDVLDSVTDRMGMDDGIRDILNLVEQEARRVWGGVRVRIEHDLNQVEQEVHNDWGGDRPYIAKAGETGTRETALRNAQILRDWRNGERTALLARRYGISTRRVRQIITETL